MNAKSFLLWPAFLMPEITRLKEDFGIRQFVMVGDRGMISSAAIATLRDHGGIDWITALKSTAIRALVEDKTIQPDLSLPAAWLVRAYIFLCMLAHTVEWHLKEAWRKLLFTDEDQAAGATRDPVAPAERSAAAKAKVAPRHHEDGTPIHSFPVLLTELTPSSCGAATGFLRKGLNAKGKCLWGG